MEDINTVKEKEMDTLGGLVNMRIVIMKSILPAKTKLSHYCQKFPIQNTKLLWLMKHLQSRASIGRTVQEEERG